MKKKYSRLGRAGYPVEAMMKALLLQWMEELSDRELERFLQENLAGKLFCGFELTEDTPDFSTFSTLRDRFGAKGVADFFNSVRQCLEDAGLVREVFTFVDATHLITKLDTWNERDKTIKAGEKKLTNLNVAKVARDKEARFGKKGPLKWYGYKLTVSVDMSQGFVCRVAATPGNVDDTKSARHVLPRSGMVFGDKAFGVGECAREMKRRRLHSGAILKKSMKAKNRDKDRWLSSVRMPYEGTFSKFEKRARYVGLVKTQYQGFMQALAHNLKRMVTLDIPPLNLRRSCA